MAPVALLAALALPTPAEAQLSAGPDAFGYVAYETDRAWVEPATGSSTGVLNLTFGFPWYGGTETSVAIGDAGLAFTGNADGDPTGCLPTGSVAEIAPFWDDLTVTAVHSETQIIDGTPAQVIAWTATHDVVGGEVRYEAILFSDGAIELVYEDVQFGDAAHDFGASAVVGIQDLGVPSAGALDISCNAADLSAGLSIRIEPCVDSDGDGFCRGVADCEDDEPTVYPGTVEVCDGFDTDCDPATDEAVDIDGDGVSACDGDCDEANPDASPDLPEACDGFDTDCDPAYEEDSDGDGDGVDLCDDDCDDANADAAPGLPETCDGFDTDCDPAYEEDSDADGDGVDLCGDDCDDFDAINFPGNPEVCDDLDNDCSGAADHPRELDPDGDGATCDDCDDDDPDYYPGAPELCDTFDNDCDGAVPGDEVDDDADGFLACAECDDGNPLAAPDQTEVCDGFDTDCDGAHIEPWTTDALPTDGFETAFRSLIGLRFRVHEDADSPNFVGLTVPLSGSLGEQVRFVLYEAPNPNVSYLPVSQADYEFPATTSSFEDITLDLPHDLQPGYFYFAAAYAFGPLTNSRRNVNDTVDYPIELPFATILAAARVDNLSESELVAVTPNPNVQSVGLRMRFGGEGDLDDDGYRACEECDDFAAITNPGLSEICDGFDNDCNGLPDADEGGETEADGDGFLSCEECDDGNADRFPGNPDICDGLDNDCDPGTDEEGDVDGDGMTVCEGDCDDADDTVRPLFLEVCDGLDTDCDATTDEDVDFDGDGQTACEGDCDDLDEERSDGAAEVCDAKDNDCDGEPAADEANEDGDDYMVCEGDCNDERQTIHPGGTEDIEQTCTDGLDNDCDGLVDDEEEESCRAFHSGCSVASRGGGWMLLGLVVLAVRRRQ